MKKKKVLIIVYYWPPSGGAGVQRWLKFVKYLPLFGVEPTVITTKNGDYPAIDHSLEKDVSKNLKVIRTKTPSFGKLFSRSSKFNAPYGNLESQKTDSLLKKISIWIRLNCVVPDARKIWNKYAFKAAKKEIQTNNYDTVITSGPPHSTHLVALKLKEKFNLKWIADFRDPWTKIDYLEKVKRNRLAELQDKKLEEKVTINCDLLLSINKKILDDLEIKKESKIIPNGFDAADFTAIHLKKNKSFTISYFGNINKDRDPEIILNALNKIPDIASQTQLNFWGNVDSTIIEKMKKKDKFRMLHFNSYIPHEEVLKKMVNSDLLLLIINNVPDNKGILTGKIYEYLGSGSSILGIGPEYGEAAQILNETRAGKMFEYSDVEKVNKFIRYEFNNWQSGNHKKETRKIEIYNRINLTKQLAEII